MAKINYIRKELEKHVVKQAQKNVVEGFKKHGYNKEQIIGALMIMALPHGSKEKAIDPEWLEIMEVWKNRFDAVVDEILKRAVEGEK